jgi:16S rRNA C967 or C1407 C5-methylase (RsmB/RsmF family)
LKNYLALALGRIEYKGRRFMDTRKGTTAFESHYGHLFGERWADIRRALLSERPRYFLVSPFDSSQSYAMDLGSVRVAEALKVEPQMDVLDMCAAPGGKSLVMLFGIKANGRFLLLDLSIERLRRLKRVMSEYIPKALMANVQQKAIDASRAGLKYPESFDRVLVDAPCSGERYLLFHAQELEHWSERRVKGLAQRQYALLCAGMQALRPGGRLVYSTCALNETENDAVVARFLKRKAGIARIVHESCDIGSKTQLGWQVVPDKDQGWGPTYWSILEKQ